MKKYSEFKVRNKRIPKKEKYEDGLYFLPNPKTTKIVVCVNGKFYKV